jgi:hypothetical protein
MHALVACRTVIDSIHDFQRQGGLSKQFEQLDKVFSTYLVASTERRRSQPQQSPQKYDAVSEEQ